MDKLCKKCSTIKPLSEFGNNKNGLYGKTFYCKKCLQKPKKILIPITNKNEKYCRKCSMVKQLSDFGKKKSNKDGYQTQCKECCELTHKKFRENNKDKRKEWQKIWVNNNSEKSKEIFKKSHFKWVQNNLEKVKESRKVYYQNNKEEIKEKNKIWAKNNPEKVKEQQKRNIIKKRIEKSSLEIFLSNFNLKTTCPKPKEINIERKLTFTKKKKKLPGVPIHWSE